jgi:MFS superfamily sulfate permease-like transporter
MKVCTYGPAYQPLLVLSGLFTLGAILTLIPNPGASWPNILGYSSLCTFAPGATFACALLAAVCCTIRARLVRRIPSPVFAPVVAIAVLALGLTVSTLNWASQKVQFKDGVSSATLAD